MWKYLVFLLVACSALSGCEEAGETNVINLTEPNSTDHDYDVEDYDIDTETETLVDIENICNCFCKLTLDPYTAQREGIESVSAHVYGTELPGEMDECTTDPDAKTKCNERCEIICRDDDVLGSKSESEGIIIETNTEVCDHIKIYSEVLFVDKIEPPSKCSCECIIWGGDPYNDKNPSFVTECIESPLDKMFAYCNTYCKNNCPVDTYDNYKFNLIYADCSTLTPPPG